MKKIILGLALLLCASFMFAEEVVNLKIGDFIYTADSNDTNDINYFIITEVKTEGDGIFAEFALVEGSGKYLYLKYHFEKDEYVPFFIFTASRQQITEQQIRGNINPDYYKRAKVRMISRNEITFILED